MPYYVTIFARDPVRKRLERRLRGLFIQPVVNQGQEVIDNARDMVLTEDWPVNDDEPCIVFAQSDIPQSDIRNITCRLGDLFKRWIRDKGKSVLSAINRNEFCEDGQWRGVGNREFGRSVYLVVGDDGVLSDADAGMLFVMVGGYYRVRDLTEDNLRYALDLVEGCFQRNLENDDVLLDRLKRVDIRVQDDDDCATLEGVKKDLSENERYNSGDDFVVLTVNEELREANSQSGSWVILFKETVPNKSHLVYKATGDSALDSGSKRYEIHAPKKHWKVWLKFLLSALVEPAPQKTVS